MKKRAQVDVSARDAANYPVNATLMLQSYKLNKLIEMNMEGSVG